MYLNYKKYVLNFDEKTGELRFGRAPYDLFLTVSVKSAQTFKSAVSRRTLDAWLITAEYGDAKLTAEMSLAGVRITASDGISFSGVFTLGENPYAVSTAQSGDSVRPADGPAIATDTDALYDRSHDSLLKFSGIKLFYDWDVGRFAFKDASELRFIIKDEYYERAYELPAPPRVKKNHPYQTPPVGWMTWYSVMFDASEETVLSNARWQAENLLEYGADTIWVDWEWYHSNKTGEDDSLCDTFAPHTGRYPHGLRYVSDEIRKLGLRPAIWIGASNDVNPNRMYKEHPEWIIADEHKWCGHLWVDPTNPQVVNEYIPAVFNQLLEWGYDAFKWDCMPDTLSICDQYHDKLSDPSRMTEDAFRDMIVKAREVIGDERYMMSCAGVSLRDMTFAADCYDGARIGGDIFKWSEFVRSCIDRTYSCFLLHNVLWYADPDNLVLREEFNTLEQTRSRVTFNALSGMPQTFGDDLPKLDSERVKMLKRALPALDTHPMQLCECARKDAVALINLAVARRWGNYNVVGIVNTGEEALDYALKLSDALHIEEGEYLVWDIWNEKLLDAADGTVALRLEPYGCYALSVHPATGRPTVLSTSRHLSAGAFDLTDVRFDGEKLCGRSKVVAGKPYKLTVWTAEGIIEHEFTPDSAELVWEL